MRAVPLALAAIVLAPEPASATACTTLEKRIRIAESNFGTGAGVNAKLVARQRAEMRKTRALQRKHLCGIRSTAACKQLDEAHAAMEKRIAKLERRNGSGNLRALRQQWREAGCPVSARKTKKPSRGSAVGSSRRVVATEPANTVVKSEAKAPPPAKVATICVRTCDGYFFPLSNAVDATLAPRDARRCAALCPSATTRLYMRPVNGTVEEMVDRSGLPYSAQRFAFRHQAEDYRPNKRCSCGTPDLGADNAEGSATPQSVPVSNTLVDGTEESTADGESRRNASVSFDWERARAFAKPPEATNRIRVVGQPFVPDR